MSNESFELYLECLSLLAKIDRICKWVCRSLFSLREIDLSREISFEAEEQFFRYKIGNKFLFRKFRIRSLLTFKSPEKYNNFTTIILYLLQLHRAAREHIPYYINSQKRINICLKYKWLKKSKSNFCLFFFLYFWNCFPSDKHNIQPTQMAATVSWLYRSHPIRDDQFKLIRANVFETIGNIENCFKQK